MRCEQAGEMMSRRLDGRVDGTEDVLLEEHVATCGVCHDEWRALQVFDRLLTSAPMVSAPVYLRAHIIARLDRRQQARRAIIGGATLALGITALALLVLAPVLPGLLGVQGMLPALVRGGPETIAQLLALLGTAGRTMLVLVEQFAVPLAFASLCGLMMIMMLNGLLIGAVRRLRATR